MTTHLLAIGVNRSEIDRNIDPLKYAEDDARAMKAFFANELGCGDHAVLLVAPTFGDVRQRLDEIGGRVHAGDTFVLYFSGHGYLVQGEPYCLLSNAELAPIRSGRTDSNDLLSVSWLRQRVLNSWPKGIHMACIVDACRKEIHTGAKGGAAMAEYRRRLEGYVGRDPLNNVGLSVSEPACNADSAVGDIEIYACPDGEISLEFDPIKRGMFTFALQSWLREGIERAEPRVLDEQLSLVLKTGVDNLAREYRKESPGQRPQVKRNGAPVVLFNPMGSVRPLTRTQQEAVDRFEAQLAAGKVDEPYGDCARDTLNRLESLHLPAQQLKELMEQMQKARQRAQELADVAYDEDLMARAREMNTAVAWSHVALTARLPANRERARRLAAERASPPTHSAPDPAELAWKRLGSHPDATQLREFLALFSQSTKAQSARERLNELDDEAWGRAVVLRSQKGFEAYLSAWPEGQHAADAKRNVMAFLAEQVLLEKQVFQPRQDDWDAALSAAMQRFKPSDSQQAVEREALARRKVSDIKRLVEKEQKALEKLEESLGAVRSQRHQQTLALDEIRVKLKLQRDAKALLVEQLKAAQQSAVIAQLNAQLDAQTETKS